MARRPNHRFDSFTAAGVAGVTLGRAVAAHDLRDVGPVVDVELHARCQDGGACPPARGRALVDTGADRTAVEVSALDPRAQATGTFRARGATGGAVDLPVVPVRVELPGGAAVEVEDAAGTPHLAAQGLVALLGRDVLGEGRLAYDGPTGAWSLDLPPGTTRVRSGTPAWPWALAGAVGLVTLGWVLWTAPPAPR